MTRPNFFILGGPKCGTTSLANWLAEHPQVCFSAIKEPHFFNFDYGGRRFTSLTRYEKLFAAATTDHRAVGEASTTYLYSRVAVPSIQRYVERPKFIVLIRNPIEMAPSLHEQFLFDGYEDVADFSWAWHLQARRAFGADLPRRCGDPQHLQYGEICKLGAQLQCLKGQVSGVDLLLLELEQLKADPAREYRKVLTFLELEDDGRESFPAKNPAKRRRLPALWAGVEWFNSALRSIGVPHIRLGLTEALNNGLREYRPRAPISPETREHLRAYFADDVRLLEDVTRLDLAHWKARQNSPCSIDKPEGTIRDDQPR